MKKSQLRNIIKQVIKEQQTTPGYICYDFNCLDVTQIGIPSAQNYINNGAPSFPNLNQCLASNCGGNDLCKGCHAANGGAAGGWANYTTWFNGWTSSSPFNSTNPNQPCNHICQRINTWQNNCAQATGLQHKNQLGCKIQAGKQLELIYQCTC